MIILAELNVRQIKEKLFVYFEEKHFILLLKIVYFKNSNIRDFVKSLRLFELFNIYLIILNK